jgi:hypothetical protein
MFTNVSTLPYLLVRPDLLVAGEKLLEARIIPKRIETSDRGGAGRSEEHVSQALALHTLSKAISVRQQWRC